MPQCTNRINKLRQTKKICKEEDRYAYIKKSYKSGVKQLFTPIYSSFNSFTNYQNKTFGTKISGFTIGAIKFAQIYDDITNGFKKSIDNAMFLGELPGSAYLMLRYLFPNANLKLNSPVGENEFLEDWYDLQKHEDWLKHESGMVQDESFLEFLKHDKSIPPGWLISDIGTERKFQAELQKNISRSMLNIIRGESNNIGRDGIIVKLYNFLDDNENLQTLSLISAHYRSFNVCKPYGSFDANDEVYIICKEKRNVPGDGLSVNEIFNKRFQFLRLTEDFFKKYKRGEKLSLINNQYLRKLANRIKCFVERTI